MKAKYCCLVQAIFANALQMEIPFLNSREQSLTKNLKFFALEQMIVNSNILFSCLKYNYLNTEQQLVPQSQDILVTFIIIFYQCLGRGHAEFMRSSQTVLFFTVYRNLKWYEPIIGNSLTISGSFISSIFFLITKAFN